MDRNANKSSFRRAEVWLGQRRRPAGRCSAVDRVLLLIVLTPLTAPLQK